MIEGLDRIEVVTLFVEDLAAARAFYEDVLGLPVVMADDASAVLGRGEPMINLLSVTRAPALVEPGAVAGPQAGARAVFTIRVADVDATCAALRRHGVALLNGPVDRPWGRRTAAFTDPAGHVWEVAQLLDGAA